MSTRRKREVAPRSKPGEAYSPSGVAAMAVLAPLCFVGAGFIAWVLVTTFVVDGEGLLESVTLARAPIPGILLIAVGALGIVVLLRIGWSGASWLYRVARGRVPRATEAQRRGDRARD